MHVERIKKSIEELRGSDHGFEDEGAPLTVRPLPLRFLSTYYSSLAAFVHANQVQG
jgi:hypothetical protein